MLMSRELDQYAAWVHGCMGAEIRKRANMQNIDNHVGMVSSLCTTDIMQEK